MVLGEFNLDFGRAETDERLMRFTAGPLADSSFLPPPSFSGRIAEVREDGACMIGLKRYASVALLGYDLFLNVFVSRVSSIHHPALLS